MYCQLGSACASWASCSNLSMFAWAHLCTSSTICFAKWRSVITAASLALSKRHLPPRCPNALNRYRSVILRGAWSIEANAVPLNFLEERKSTVTDGDAISTERRMWSGLLCSPVYPCHVFPSQQGFDGTDLAAQVDGLQSCAALQISPMCAPLSVRFSHARCHPIAASSRGSPLKSPPKIMDVRLGSFAIVFDTWSQKRSLCYEGPFSCDAYPAKMVRSPCASQFFTRISPNLPAIDLGGLYLCTICPAPTVASRMAMSTPHAWLLNSPLLHLLAKILYPLEHHSDLTGVIVSSLAFPSLGIVRILNFVPWKIMMSASKYVRKRSSLSWFSVCRFQLVIDSSVTCICSIGSSLLIFAGIRQDL